MFHKFFSKRHLVEKSTCTLVAYVKDSVNGPGHVSLSVIRQGTDGTKIHHTSLIPAGFGSLVNAMTLGSLPVPGKLYHDHSEDLEEANHVLTMQISEKQYQGAREAQRQLAKKLQHDHSMYSVFGSLNPMASAFAALFSAHRNAELTTVAHVREYGMYPSEGFDGCLLHGFDAGPVEQKVEVKVDNCASALTQVLHGAGIPIQNYHVPTFFTPALIENGFNKVPKSDFMESLSAVTVAALR